MNDVDVATRLEFIQKTVDAFWRKWTRDYFPTLLIRQKWHVDCRNLQLGDIVLVKDNNVLRGNWKLAEVQSVTVGKDNSQR